MATDLPPSRRPGRHDDPVVQEALDWVIRLREPDADWPGFSAWLAADAAHGEAYWPLAEADRTIGDVLAVPPPPPIVAPVAVLPAPRRPRMTGGRGRIIGWTLAAALAGVIGIHALRPSAGGETIIETRPGETRSVDLPDGSRVAMNGATRLIVDRGRPRTLRLDRGEASFTVRHDPADPFTINVGGDRIVDVGTRFDVVRDRGETRVAVAEGAIDFSRGAATQRLDAGQSLRATDAGRALALGTVDPGDVGGWRARRLVYDRAPLAMVAADLTRSTGTMVTIAPGLEARMFTGSLTIASAPGETMTRLATMIDARASRRGDGWVIAPR